MAGEFITLSRSVAGLAVFVTGGASGIGRATARVFGAEGARVAVTDRDAEGAKAVAAGVCDAGGEAAAWALDVSDKTAIERVVAEAAARFGGLDIIVNNAGVSLPTKIDAGDADEKWERLLTILLTAQARVIRAALPFLRASKSPRIINIASTEAISSAGGSAAYAAAKAGVTGMTRSLAVELGRDGVTVNSICPGPINTGMTSRIPDDQKQTFAHRRTALRRYGMPEEIAHMIVSLALPAASYVTGATIPVDGGLTIRAG